ncbi:Inner membrane transport permease YadH [Acaryochloris thomasi RCC1774]|uniref:Transport permease protein n=1 Tax=Acaryochloris thomasi RCC1774 TaxID=1764569 RepID=A0A2W1JGA6_9CYAN|nr:ABC transporter permease [Acaryochloris thomasi]PZD72588.1 Inner membrane transport permease YadH [Acaryochloris thomasi RCC1774]
MTLNLDLPVKHQSKSSFLIEIWLDSLTIFWGEWLDLRVRVKQIVASGMVSPLIYILAFGLGLGNSLPKPAVGDNYLEFILPGMIALSSMTICFAGTTFSICGDRLFSKTFEELLLLPIHPLSLYLGKVMAGVARGLLTSSSVIVIAILFTGKILSFLNPLFLALLVLNCAVFAGLGVLAGLSVQSIESVGLYNNFLIVPMSFLGGTFFDPTSLPPVFKVLVYALPLTYTSMGLRAAAYQPIADFPWSTLPILLLMALILAGIGGYQFSHQQD